MDNADNTIVTPIIHPNGDSAEVLLTNLKEAFRAVRAAIEAVYSCAPNGRNYYPEPGRFKRALVQNDERLAKLLAVKQSIRDEAIALQRIVTSARTTMLS